MSEEFRNLGVEQRSAFERRLQFCCESLDNAELFVTTQDSSRNGLLDDVELDTYSLLSSGRDAKTVSPYLPHSSWTSDSDRLSMAAATSPLVTELFGHPMLTIMSNNEQVVEWFRRWIIALRDVIDKFNSSPTYDYAIAQCICIDALMAAALATLAILRLNPSVDD